MARELGVGIAEHRAFLVCCRRAQVASLEACLERDGNLHGLVADSRAADPESAVETAEVRQRLLEVIKTLGEKERVVTTFYFYEGLTRTLTPEKIVIEREPSGNITARSPRASYNRLRCIARSLRAATCRRDSSCASRYRILSGVSV